MYDKIKALIFRNDFTTAEKLLEQHSADLSEQQKIKLNGNFRYLIVSAAKPTPLGHWPAEGGRNRELTWDSYIYQTKEAWDNGILGWELAAWSAEQGVWQHREKGYH